MYMPKDLHVTHICFYATHPRLAHSAHMGLELHSFNLDDNALIPSVLEGSSFEAQSSSITWKVEQAMQPKTVGQQELQRAPPPMRALVVASDVETRSGRQLADAAEVARMQNEKKPSEAEKGHDPINASLRMLYDHWLLHRRSLARIGTFGRSSELFPISSILR